MICLWKCGMLFSCRVVQMLTLIKIFVKWPSHGNLPKFKLIRSGGGGIDTHVGRAKICFGRVAVPVMGDSARCGTVGLVLQRAGQSAGNGPKDTFFLKSKLFLIIFLCSSYLCLAPWCIGMGWEIVVTLRSLMGDQGIFFNPSVETDRLSPLRLVNFRWILLKKGIGLFLPLKWKSGKSIRNGIKSWSVNYQVNWCILFWA